MNAKHTTRAQPTHQPATASESVSGLEEGSDEMLISALLDGELSETELNDWLSSEPEMGEAATHAQTYQFIGDTLRGHSSLTDGTSASIFLAGVQSRLLSEALQAVPKEPLPQSQATEVALVRSPAANDSVFRWKLVAGLASLAAVMAVSWSVLTNAPTGGGPSAAAPQLALSQPAQEGNTAIPAVKVTDSAAAPLAVNTRQGVLIRDAALEALMAEHRQHGGVSALQMPAGFLRNATYDPDAR